MWMVSVTLSTPMAFFSIKEGLVLPFFAKSIYDFSFCNEFSSNSTYQRKSVNNRALSEGRAPAMPLVGLFQDLFVQTVFLKKIGTQSPRLNRKF